jgi:hypothetical protein
MNKPNTVEALSLLHSKKGTIFYTNKDDKSMTAIAVYYKRKISTERMILVSYSSEILAEKLTKVTILD